MTSYLNFKDACGIKANISASISCQSLRFKVKKKMYTCVSGWDDEHRLVFVHYWQNNWWSEGRKWTDNESHALNEVQILK